jgi:hypothetical protein
VFEEGRIVGVMPRNTRAAAAILIPFQLPRRPKRAT